MELWREKAAELFPELEKEVGEAENPYLLWFELRAIFEYAYGPPWNESLIKRVYEYAYWCESQPRGQTAEDDLLTVVAVCFYEHLPEHPAARADMPRWFTRDEIMAMKSLFCYRISESDFAELLKLFPPDHSHRSKRRQTKHRRI